MKKLDLTGMKFSRLTAVKEVEPKRKPSGQKEVKWLCLCECGNQISVSVGNLRTGHTKSCGCFRAEKMSNKQKVHGMSQSRLYGIYTGIKTRCLNANEPAYKDYGGRGIKMCDEWLNDFMAFYDWAMANGYNDNLSIDRIDVNGNYEPSNCQWATRKEQNNNKRNNHLITYKGKTQTIAQWANEKGLSYKVLYTRLIDYKWAIDKALTTPVQNRNHKMQESRVIN